MKVFLNGTHELGDLQYGNFIPRSLRVGDIITIGDGDPIKVPVDGNWQIVTDPTNSKYGIARDGIMGNPIFLFKTEDYHVPQTCAMCGK